MTIKNCITEIEKRIPLAQAEDFDNVGLLCGNPEREVIGILICHDALESVIDEAIQKKCNLIVCFHPIIFSGLKSITGKNYVEKAILKALENKIAIYAIHTAWDNDFFGVNHRICQELGLQNPKILILDDSTSAVDTKTDKLIREAFKNEIPDITKIIIAQRISSVKDADKIIVLDDGKVTGIGIHEELIISNDIYKEVHNSQEEGEKNNE